MLQIIVILAVSMLVLPLIGDLFGEVEGWVWTARVAVLILTILFVIISLFNPHLL